ncbi:MAG: hypothetical protein JWN04_5704 [Myxococcaceae bacterium]|nr:hypothetical protein [Myxococcaceae bacterium]
MRHLQSINYMERLRSLNYVQLLVLLVVWLAASHVLASTVGVGGVGGGALPWDSGIGSLRGSVKNTIGPALVIIGIVLTFGSVLLGGEIQEFGRRGPALIAGGAGVIGADSIMSMFGAGGLL